MHVGVAEEHPLPAGALQPFPERIQLPQPPGGEARHVDRPDAWILGGVRIHQGGRSVGGAIVDQHHLQRRVTLGEAAADRWPERGLLVASRNDERDPGPARRNGRAILGQHRDAADHPPGPPGLDAGIGQPENGDDQPADLDGGH
jgi:hypothetical protein